MTQKIIVRNDEQNIQRTNVQVETMHALCKEVLKSRIFRGFYEERRYEDTMLESYRDIIVLQNEEKELEKLLWQIKEKLSFFYMNKIWIGITASNACADKLSICIWTKLDNLAFGQYWFLIKTVRFTDTEIALKLKMVRPVEMSRPSKMSLRAPISTTSMSSNDKSSWDSSHADWSKSEEDSSNNQIEQQIKIEDFIALFKIWLNSSVNTIYNFLQHSITKENLKENLRFIGLLIVSTLSACIFGLKALGYFTLRFLVECRHLTQVLTPIVLKIIELLSKAVGGFYILLAMIWRDMVHKPPVGKLKNTGLEYKPTLDFAKTRRSRNSFQDYERKWQ